MPDYYIDDTEDVAAREVLVGDVILDPESHLGRNWLRVRGREPELVGEVSWPVWEEDPRPVTLRCTGAAPAVRRLEADARVTRLLEFTVTRPHAEALRWFATEPGLRFDGTIVRCYSSLPVAAADERQQRLL